MNPARVLVSDIIRYHRHLARAYRAGYPATEQGVREYALSVRKKRATRAQVHRDTDRRHLLRRLADSYSGERNIRHL